MESLIVTLKKPSEARYFQVGTVPGAVSSRYLGGKRIQITTDDVSRTEAWLDTPGNVAAYEYA